MSGADELDLAEAAFVAKDYGAALEHARAALLSGLDLGAHDSERGEYAPKEQSSRAAQLLAMALNQGPYALLCRGLLYRALGNLEQARADIQPWLALDPNRAKYLADLDREIEAKSGA